MAHCNRIFLYCVLLGMLLSLPAAAVTLKGKVVDAAGAPVADATVFIAQDRQVRKAVTGKDGRYQFDDIRIRLLELVAYKEGYALDGVTSVPQGDVEEVLTLQEADSISLRIITNTFLPIPGAVVKTMMVNDRFVVSVEDLAREGLPRLRSNDAGILDIPMLPAKGFVKLTVGHYRHADSNVAYLPVDARRNDIILYEGTQLRGRVTSGDKPVADARVVLFQVGVAGQRRFAEAVTDPEGYYQLRASEETYLLTAWHADYASPVPSEVDLLDREATAVVNLELLPPYIINGSITLPDGKPCPGARVLFRHENTIYDDAITDSAGEYRLQVGSPEGVLRLLPPPGYMTEILADIPVNLGEVRETTIDTVKLKALPRIRGKVVFPEGEPPTRVYLKSLDLPLPIHDLTTEEGDFEIQFFYQPEQKTVKFRLEHPFRLLRRDFVVNIEAPGEVELLLEPFEPNMERRPHQLGRNNLEGLLGEDAPPVQCATWFNSQPLTIEELKGKVVVLTFWGGFDDSLFSRNRMMELRVLHELYREQTDVAVIAVHDASSEADEIQEYLVQYGIEFPVGKDDDPFVSFVNYSVNFIPQTVLIDKQGKVQYYQPEGRLLELVKALRRR